MHSDLAEGELIIAIRIPKFSRTARFGFHKICRKTGEFAEAIGVVAHDPQRAGYRLVASAPAGAPLVLQSAGRPDSADLTRRLIEAGFAGDGIELELRSAVLQRALAAAEGR